MTETTMRERIQAALSLANGSEDLNETTDAVLAAMRTPTRDMLIAALPVMSRPTDEQRKIGAEASAILGGNLDVGTDLAAELARDWSLMIDCARNGG